MLRNGQVYALSGMVGAAETYTGPLQAIDPDEEEKPEADSFTGGSIEEIGLVFAAYRKAFSGARLNAAADTGRKFTDADDVATAKDVLANSKPLEAEPEEPKKPHIKFFDSAVTAELRDLMNTLREAGFTVQTGPTFGASVMRWDKYSVFGPGAIREAVQQLLREWCTKEPDLWDYVPQEGDWVWVMEDSGNVCRSPRKVSNYGGGLEVLPWIYMLGTGRINRLLELNYLFAKADVPEPPEVA